MTPKNSAAKVQNTQNTPAEDTLADLIEMEGTEDNSSEENNIPQEPSSNDNLTSAATLAVDDEMESIGGNGPRVEVFLTYEAYDGMKPTDKVINAGDSFDGQYLGSFVSGQYNSRKHKVRPTSGPLAGKVIGLPVAGALDKKFQFAPFGTRTIVEYKGRATKAEVGPTWKGQLPYRYEVALPKSVNAAIEAGTLTANYELKKKDA